MFKKKCNHCDKKLERSSNFCPHCGKPQKDKRKEWGMLGQDDSVRELEQMPNNLLGGDFLNKIMGSAMKMVEKEMQKTMQKPEPNSNFKLYINGKMVDPANIKVTKMTNNKKVPTKTEQIEQPKIRKDFSQKQKEIYSSLPKKTPEVNMRRLAKTIVCEIEVPEVKEITDISINQINKTIEIKAISKENSYFKVIEMAYPIINYNLEEEKIILELKIDE
jgi:HSP20 family molecular chaperone IbpA